MGVAVRLDWSEVLQAAIAGAMRHVSALKDGRTDRGETLKAKGWQSHIEGAVGEYVAAKYFNRHWSATVGRVDTADVGDFEVRASIYRSAHLIIYADDNDDARFFLVTGNGRDHELVGWIWGREGKRPEWWRTPPDCESEAYFVPQSALHPMKRKESP